MGPAVARRSQRLAFYQGVRTALRQNVCRLSLRRSRWARLTLSGVAESGALPDRNGLEIFVMS